jgi:hypothetical protein
LLALCQLVTAHGHAFVPEVWRRVFSPAPPPICSWFLDNADHQ